jgi:hypothetical protein
MLGWGPHGTDVIKEVSPFEGVGWKPSQASIHGTAVYLLSVCLSVLSLCLSRKGGPARFVVMRSVVHRFCS